MSTLLAALVLAGCVAQGVYVYRTLQPQRRRSHHLAVARQAVQAAEQRHGKKQGFEKARYARQHLLDVLQVTPHQADVLVEGAVAELKEKT